MVGKSLENLCTKRMIKVCLFELMLVRLGFFLGGNRYLEVRIKCLAEGQNTVPLVSLEPETSRSQVKHSTTWPQFSFFLI